jgi:hypothetical protein
MHRPATLLVLVLVLGGLSIAGPTRAPAGDRVGILAIGDFGAGGARERSSGSSMRRFEAGNPANVLVTLGDNDYTRSARAFRRNWAAGFGWLRSSGLTVSGVLGNHDVGVGNGDYELATLGMPAHYYTRVIGDVELFMLDSNDVHTTQTQWLESELASSTQTWKIAVFHHPAYSCGVHMGDDHVVRRWVPLFERYHVQLVLSAHEHSYQRFAPRNGVVYVVHGGGGQVLYRPRRCPDAYPARVRSRREFGFLYIVVQDDQLEGWAVRFSGRRIDRFSVAP